MSWKPLDDVMLPIYSNVPLWMERRLLSENLLRYGLDDREIGVRLSTGDLKQNNLICSKYGGFLFGIKTARHAVRNHLYLLRKLKYLSCSSPCCDRAGVLNGAQGIYLCPLSHCLV